MQTRKLSVETRRSISLKLDALQPTESSKARGLGAAYEEIFAEGLRVLMLPFAVAGGSRLLKSSLRNEEPRLGLPVEAL
ncbi:hypothetical protein [Bradyrhizobium iriomotense]|uniref:hypothetical protein n=1 Tax=Bradyrhizobium iriomotense TaxID=441950 RepID=UPI0024E05158|nr:hypothetical protein [Bradyrhizobium iriomotense]